MTVLILHGIQGHPGIHWQQWLHDELIKKGHKVIMPALPDSNHPDRKTWSETALKSVADTSTKDLVIVGHSLGVPTALDLIEQLESPIAGGAPDISKLRFAIKALVSVSGFFSDYGAELNGYFLREKGINFDAVNKNLEKAFVVYGDDDPYVPQEELKSLAENLNAKPVILPKGGHLNTNTGYTTFPLLLEIIKNL